MYKVYVTDSGFPKNLNPFSRKLSKIQHDTGFNVIKFTYMVSEIRKRDHEMQLKTGPVV